jgi:hypothetical protein
MRVGYAPDYFGAYLSTKRTPAKLEDELTRARYVRGSIGNRKYGRES